MWDEAVAGVEAAGAHLREALSVLDRAIAVEQAAHAKHMRLSPEDERSRGEHRARMHAAWRAVVGACSQCSESACKLELRNGLSCLARIEDLESMKSMEDMDKVDHVEDSSDSDGSSIGDQSAEAGAKLLRRGLGAFPSDRVIQREGMQAMVNLSCHRAARATLAHGGALALARAALTDVVASTDHKTVEAAFGAIGNLAGLAGESDVCKADANGALGAAQTAMAQFDLVQSVQVRGLMAIVNLLGALGSDAAFDDEVLSATVLAAMRNFQESQSVHQYGLMAVVNGIRAHPSLAGELYSSGCSITVKQALWAFDLDPVISKWGAEALELLSAAD